MTAPTIQWNMYSGPGSVTFDDSTQTNATATFSVPGSYILMLSANDGIHAVAYDALNVNVTANAAFQTTISRTENTIDLTWNGSASEFVLEQTLAFPAQWTPILTTAVHTAAIPMPNQAAFYRIREK